MKMPRGKKNCPSCKKEVRATVKKCECEYIFVKNSSVKENSAEKIYSSIGRGRKICPSCDKVVGAKTFKCDCSFNFSISSKHRARKKNYKYILGYVLNKIEQKNYRDHRVEHHRATADSRKVKIIVEAIYDLFYNKYPINVDTIVYGMIVDRINERIGHVTRNSFKKNILVDLDRMEYVIRIGADGRAVPKRGKKNVYSMVLTKAGMDMARVKSGNGLRREQIHSDASIRLMGKEYVNSMLALMDEVKFISVKEFMYFVSGEIDYLTISQNINKYRSLSLLEQKMVDEKIEDEISSINKKASDKTEKRDIFGWRNEVTQICEILKNIPGFNFSNNILTK